MKTVFVFGNQDLAADSLPLRILPDLQKSFPDILFTVKDPNEEWEITDPFIMIDTIIGIDQVTVFNGLENFIPPPAISVHDFDIMANLRYLQKLGKLKTIKIVGIPPTISEKKALQETKKNLRTLF